MSSAFPQSRMMEIPIIHETSHFPQRTSTPPRVNTPPRTESPTFYTLPRNHRVQPQQDRVREIPIQHFISRSMSPSRQGQGRTEPHPDYPASRDSTPTSQTQLPQGPPQPQPSYPQYPQPSESTTGNGYPRKQEYPQQVYPPAQQPQQQPYQQQQQSFPQQQPPYPQSSQSYPPSQPQAYPQPQPGYQQPQQGYPQPQQGYPQPQSQQGYPQPQSKFQPQQHQQPYAQSKQQGYPQQSYPQQQNSFEERQKRFPAPGECRPPQHDEVVHTIPIIREEIKDAKQGFGTWPRQPKQPRSSFPNDMKTESMPQTYNQKTQDQNQNARDQPDSGQIPQDGNSQTDNSAKTEQPKQVKPKTPIELIEQISHDCKDLEDRVMTFKGSKKDKEYKFLEEMLTRSILKLDGIESGADDTIRQARKTAVRQIQSYLDQLELKAFSQGIGTSSGEQKMDTDSSQSSNKGNSNSADMDTSQSQSVQSRSDTSDERKVKEMVLDSEVAC